MITNEKRWISPGNSRPIRRFFPYLTLLLVASLSFTMINCDRSNKTVKLKLKLNPGLEVIYNNSIRSKQIVIEGDSVISEVNQEQHSKYTETVDSLSGDTASWVTAISVVISQQCTQSDTTITDTVKNDMQYQYLGRPTGEILSLLPLVGVDQEWADYQLENLKQVQPTFPQTDISVGYSWTKTIKVLLLDETREATGVYTLKSFVRERGYDCAVIEYEGHYHMPAERETEKAKVTGISTITTKGTIYFAYREGIMIEDKVWWVFNSDRKIEYLADSEDGYKVGTVRQISIVTEGDTRFTLADVSFPEAE